ncbi:MAG: exodeoxyribonuclease VII small subunit [Lachnospiraceae bacterium]|nr:exodeoxyribonuclease VII small subunit [Lachnospiraceae bacterium]
MADEEKRSLEQKFSRLEDSLAKLEDDKLPLDQAFALYQEGMKLLKECNEEIDRVEKQVLLLREDGSTDVFEGTTGVQE